MSNLPNYSVTPIVGVGTAPATADTSTTAPANATTLSFTAALGASGTQIYEIIAEGLGATVAGLVNVFLHDGSTYHMFDSYVVGAPAWVAAGAVPPWRYRSVYTSLWIPANTWSLRFTVNVAGNQSLIKLSAYGANF